MTMNQNYQPTSAPYSADNLDPHDPGLVWSKEFGTNTTADTGQAFNTSDSSGAPTMTVDARLGMLKCEQNGEDPDSMAGSTFLLPEWESFAESPALGPDNRLMLVHAHLLLQEVHPGDPNGTHAMLVMGSENFVGNVDDIGPTSVSIRHAEGGEATPASVIVDYWGANADNSPTDTFENDLWGTNLYIRMLIGQNISDLGKESEMGLFLSQDGISWTLAQSLQVGNDGAMRRIGLGVYGAPGTALLDWVRVYDYALESFSQESGVFRPNYPLIGGRRF